MEGHPRAGRQPFMLGQPPFDAASREQRQKGEPRAARGKRRTRGAVHPGRAHTRRRRRSPWHAGETSLSTQQPRRSRGAVQGVSPHCFDTSERSHLERDDEREHSHIFSRSMPRTCLIATTTCSAESACISLIACDRQKRGRPCFLAGDAHAMVKTQQRSSMRAKQPLRLRSCRADTVGAAVCRGAKRSAAGRCRGHFPWSASTARSAEGAKALAAGAPEKRRTEPAPRKRTP